MAALNVTGLLHLWRGGDEAALQQLIPLVQEELHRIAVRCMRGERAEHSLQATALVNEAYVRLVDARQVNWQDRSHFLAIAARLMRRVLVDHARARLYEKRGGRAKRVTLVEELGGSDERPYDLVALDEALETLGRVNARRSQVVEMRFFGGLSVEETAQVLGVSTDTVSRDWKLARAWLFRELSRGRTAPT